MRLRILAICTLLVSLAFVSGSAWADSLSVQNASFETTNPPTSNCGPGCYINAGPVPGWVTTGVEAGSWQPGTSGIYFNPNAVPDGSSIAYVVEASLSQDLGAVLQPDTNYTLTVDVGDRTDGFLGGNYTIALEVGGAVMCTFTGDNLAITPGTFAAESCSFGTGATVPAGDLSIVLSDFSGEATFDNVSVATPEGSSIVLLATGILFVGLLGMYYRRQQTLQASAS